MTVNTKAYGTVEVDERQKIQLPLGLYGFESVTEYILMDAQQRPFYWLQSLEVRELAFALLDPVLIRQDYNADLDPMDLKALDLNGIDDDNLLQFAIVTIPEDRRKMTANLQGPIIINKDTREGRQCIARNGNWRVQHNILEEMSSAGKNIC